MPNENHIYKPPTLFNIKSDQRFDIQMITFDSNYEGTVNVPTLFNTQQDTDFIVEPWDIHIRLTDKTEPKNPKFKVIKPKR